MTACARLKLPLQSAVQFLEGKGSGGRAFRVPR